MRWRVISGVLGLTAALLMEPFQANASSCEKIAEIQAMADADGTIVRHPGSEPKPAVKGMPLFPGSEIDFAGASHPKASLTLVLSSQGKPLTMTKRRDPSFQMPGDCAAEEISAIEETLEAIDRLIPDSDAPQITIGVLATPKRNSDAELEGLVPSLIFEKGRVYKVGSDQSQVSAGWDTISGFLILSDPRTGATLARSSPGRDGYASVALPDAPPGLRLQLHVEGVTGEISEPVQIELADPASRPTPAQRAFRTSQAAQAAWQYYQAGAAWQIDAFSTLYELNEAQDDAAFWIWRKIVVD